MAAPNVHTWADGFGRWHAEVRTGTRNERKVARDAIVEELRFREGPNFDPSVVKVEKLSTGIEVAEYREVAG